MDSRALALSRKLRSALDQLVLPTVVPIPQHRIPSRTYKRHVPFECPYRAGVKAVSVLHLDSIIARLNVYVSASHDAMRSVIGGFARLPNLPMPIGRPHFDGARHTSSR